MENNIVKEYHLGGSTLWLLFIQDLPDAEFERMYVCCGAARQEKIKRLKSELKRKQSVGAGYLLFLLKEQFGIEEEAVALPAGKPVFPENSDIHFSISHSGVYVALAFGKSPLGVDIECVKRANLKVAKRFFQKEEYERLTGQMCGQAYPLDQSVTNAEAEKRADIFCKIWTGKEAVVKASGEGLSTPLDSFSVLKGTVDCAGDLYELHSRKFTDGGQNFWVSVAQVVL